MSTFGTSLALALLALAVWALSLATTGGALVALLLVAWALLVAIAARRTGRTGR